MFVLFWTKERKSRIIYLSKCIKYLSNIIDYIRYFTLNLRFKKILNVGGFSLKG